MLKKLIGDESDDFLFSNFGEIFCTSTATASASSSSAGASTATGVLASEEMAVDELWGEF